MCQCCTVIGRSCRGTGGGPIKCLKAQGWHKSAKGIWYCPACRYDNVDVPYDWSPDWRALQNEERNADGATCDCPKGPCPNTAAPKCPCPKMEVDEECLTAVAAPSIIPLLSAPKTREPHWEGHAMHESWPFPLGLQHQEHELGCNSWRGCCNSGCCSSGCFEGPGTKAVTAQVTRCMDCSRAMSADKKKPSLVALMWGRVQYLWSS